MTMLNWKEIQKGDNGGDGVGINKTHAHIKQETEDSSRATTPPERKEQEDSPTEYRNNSRIHSRG